jgi:hypothetical protein
VARGGLALVCVIQTVATLTIDLNHTHATNPQWPRHARFHLVWQALTTAVLSVLEVTLIYWPGPFEEERFYLAILLTCLPLLAFLGALISRRIYDGALSDPNGIRPLRIAFFGTVRHMDMNVVAVTAALMTLAALIVIYTL